MSYRYYPRRPVKSFQDLEVYQKTLGLGVEIVKKINHASASLTSKVKSSETLEVFPTEANTISKNLIETVLEVPKLIATAHSVRFGDSQRAIDTLEETMLSCNLAVVYLEQYRDLINPTKITSRPAAEIGADVSKAGAKSQKGHAAKRSDNLGSGTIGTGMIEHDFFEEQIKEYLRVRGKILRLQRSWIRFMRPKEEKTR